MTAFTESALDEKAQAVIEREEKLRLSERDFALFVEAIENPRPVGARLQATAQGFKATRAEHPEPHW